MACMCRGTHCRPGFENGCNNPNRDYLWGRQGPRGFGGGDMRVVAREVIVGSNVRLDVSGGRGGPPGPSGRIRCENPGDRNDFCYSGTASNYGNGADGDNGRSRYEAGTKS